MSLERILTAVGILIATVVLANVVDHLLKRRKSDLPPAALTRYRALRRTVFIVILTAGVAMAAFVFPSVRGVAGALLTSAAVVGVIVGIAAKSSVGNFISGLVIAFSQPIRLGDRIEFQGTGGVVDDVGRIYTRVRTSDGTWLQIPNDLLASDTIRNWTIVDPECTAEVRLLLPLSSDLASAMTMVLEEARTAPGAIAGREPTVSVESLVGGLGGTKAELAVDVWVSDHVSAEAVSSDLRLRIHERLRRAGMFGDA